MNVDPNARYSESHEWVRKEGDSFAYGITDHAQDQLSDLVYLEPPEIGESFEKGDTIGVVESVKAASDLYLPMGGEITEINEALVDAPEVMNSDPYSEGWIVKFAASDPAEYDRLMDVTAYEEFVEEAE
ncbi:glycine cleavage system protein GcvH [Chloroflexota bacterium]